MALLDDLVEQVLVGDPDAVYDMAADASAAEQATALKAAKRRLESYGYKDQAEREALRRAESALSKGDDGGEMTFAAEGEGMSTTTKVVLAGGGLFAVWFLFIRKKK